MIEKLFALNITIVLLIVILGLVHIIILLGLVHKSRNELTSGQLKDFIGATFVVISIGFLFFLWSMLIKLGILNIKNQVLDIVITTIIAVSFLMSLTHMAYSAKDIGKSFGFSNVGEKITNLAKKK